MNCETVLRSLDFFRTLEVDRRERDDLSRHLESCAECAEELARLEALAEELAGLQLHAPKRILDWVLTNSTDHYAFLSTELGPAWVGYNDHGITMLRLSDSESLEFEADYQIRLGRRPRPGRLPRHYADIIRRAAKGETAGAVPLDLSGLSPFEREVLLLLKQIPRGEVRPYGWLARQAGRPKAARAVGQALGRNPLPLLLPCHRVVPAEGGVGKYIFGSKIKRRLLKREGVPLDEL